MRFMAVQGIGYWVSTAEPRTLHVLVTGDDRIVVKTLRDEEVGILEGERSADLDWQVDQYTQETIGVTLASEGWEVFSISGLGEEHENAPGSSPVYLVRQ